MNINLVSLFNNDDLKSIDAMNELRRILVDRNVSVTNEYSEDSDLIICVGGDGSFLETVHKCNFPNTPIIGINTGHLGFFQEACIDEVGDFLDEFINGFYRIQELNTLNAIVTTNDGKKYVHECLNEVVIRGRQSKTIHLDISINGVHIEKFSGDGILCASSAGSTAYNYSLGGALVDPRLKLLQVTPMAPMNTIAYRSFTSSIMLPPDREFTVSPANSGDSIFVVNDGIENVYTDVKEISVDVSDKTIKLIRFKDYHFWSKVKSKFL
ncbi:MAG: NAD(+)/NADH kinase [Eubacterium sp.]|nr:NAD(+)/NADH kinase [Candidatus Colimonas fimequi]